MFYRALKTPLMLSVFLKQQSLGNIRVVHTKFSETPTFLTPLYAHVPLRIRELEMLLFRELLRTY